MAKKFPKQEPHLRDYLGMLLKHKWIILASILLIVPYATFHAFRMTPVYEATCRIIIEKEAPMVMDIKQVEIRDTSYTNYYETQYEILKSRSLAGSVIEELNLKESPEFAPMPPNWISWIDKLKDWVKTLLPLEKEKQEKDEQNEYSALIDSYLKRLEVNPVRDSSLMDISFEGQDPALIAKITNTHARLYMEKDLERRSLAIDDATNWLYQELSKQKERVKESQVSLQKFKAEHEIISITPLEEGGEKEAILAQRFSDLDAKLTEAKIEGIELRILRSELKNFSRRPEMMESLPGIIDNPFIRSLKTQYISLFQEYSELSKKFGKNYPKMVQLRSEMESLKDKIGLEVKKIAKNINIRYQMARAREESLKESLEEQKRRSLELSQLSIQYGVLKNEVESNQKLYEALLSRVKETDLTGQLRVSNISVVDPAEVPRKPSKPKKGRDILLSFILALMGGIGLSLFLEYMDNTIKKPEDIERYLDIPFLGVVGRFKPLANPKKGELLIGLDPGSNISESLRNIRTNILFSASSTQLKILLLTSSIKLEGKTFISANLAITMAGLGKRVLLVDADMRKPRIHQLFGLKKSPGLSDLLVGEAPPKSVIQATHIKNLQVITSGTTSPSPSELLASTTMQSLIRKAKDKFDTVILDSPPVMSVTDPVELATMVDGVVFVIKGGSTPRPPIQRAIQQLSEVEARMLGAILNDVDFKKQGYHYQYYYKYYYGYGEKRKR